MASDDQHRPCCGSHEDGTAEKYQCDDGYVTYHSARIELCPASSWDYSRKGHVFTDMLNNCLDQIRASSDGRTFMRCDVNFDTLLRVGASMQ
ncbi:hypothetical protein AAC387_Pa05g0660 [Persea americana]